MNRPARSARSSRFRESIHLIPTPGVQEYLPKRYEPLVLKSWVVNAVALTMIGLGIALEVVLLTQSDGFYVPPKDIFGFVSTNFLTSFIPTLVVVPLAYLWSIIDWMLRWYQPYVTLSKGNAPAEESILLDYIALNRLKSLQMSLKHRHWLIFISALTAFAVTLLQPLAGSVFQVKDIIRTTTIVATSTTMVGLSPTVNQLDAFLAAAGYANAAVFNNLHDPTFVCEVWATAEFVLPSNNLINGTISITTAGIKTEVNCANPASLNLSTLPTGDLSIYATTSDGCSKNVTLNPTSSNQQYGVTNVENCPDTPSNPSFQPVMFWFFYTGSNNESQAAGVVCRPTIDVFNVVGFTNLNNAVLMDVTMVSNYTISNNVTGSPLNGQAYNGVVFESSNDTTVQARAAAINLEVPGAMFQSAVQRPNGPQSTFSAPNGFLDITSSVYTQHLALATKSIYFVPNNADSPAILTSQVPRLLLEPLPTHALSAILVLIGIIGLGLHTVHGRLRKKLRLTSPPGSIAAIVSLTSRSGFGELLVPYDDQRTISQKLSGLTFRLDKRTGAIVADDDQPDVEYNPYDDATTLLGKHETAYSPDFSTSALSGVKVDNGP